MLHKFMISAAVLALAAPSAVFAQDYGWYQHQQDHQEHGLFHDEVDAAHAQAHEEGFASQAEHDGYHRALRQTHDAFHDDHPGTRHDGYRLPSRNSYGYSPYGYSYGYSPYQSSYAPSDYYGYSPYQSGYAPNGYYGYSPYQSGYAPNDTSVLSLFFGFGR